MMGVDDIIGAGLSIINKFIPDPAAKAQAAAELRAQILAASASTDIAQNQTNTSEATNTSLFVSGWRPAIGWVCASALAYQYLIRALLTFALQARYGVDAHVPTLPGLDDNLWQLLTGMLGLGTLRTVEKIKAVASK